MVATMMVQHLLSHRVIPGALLWYLFCWLLGWPMQVSSTKTVVSTTKGTGGHQNPYLKEIVMGRCYERPPSSTGPDDIGDDGIQLCPFTVASLVGVMESHLDSEITPESFYLYWGSAVFDSPQDSALLVWPPPPNAPMAAGPYVLPETTPGGSLMQGLVFCGVDRKSDCPSDYWTYDSGALLSFWQGVYTQFATHVEGRVRMVIQQDDMKEIPALWKDHVVPYLNSTYVSSLDIVATNCQSNGVLQLTKALQKTGKIDAKCTAMETSKESTFGWCQVADLLDPGSQSSGTSDSDNSVPPPDEPKTEETPTTAAPVPAMDCDCPTTTTVVRSTGNVYKYLFWILVVLLVAGGYAFWSVRSYLPEYRSVPDVADSELGGQRQLPKQ
jgi:hypothetical protein